MMFPMGLSSKPNSSTLSATLPFLLNFGLIIASSVSAPNRTNFNCTNPPMLSSLLDELIGHSSNSMFYETDIGDDTTAISGLFQCRFDLTHKSCHNCIEALVGKLSNTLCADLISFPTRVQLSGCYLRFYDPDKTTIRRRNLVEHKDCSDTKAWFNGFEDLRAQAFRELSGCVIGSGFCETRYEGMHLKGQCEESLGDCDCAGCVTDALQAAEEQCEDSVSAVIYLENCFVSYDYESNRHGGGSFSGREGGGNSSNKLVAIVLGGGAAAGLLLVIWFFIKSSRKKSDDW